MLIRSLFSPPDDSAAVYRYYAAGVRGQASALALMSAFLLMGVAAACSGANPLGGTIRDPAGDEVDDGLTGKPAGSKGASGDIRAFRVRVDSKADVMTFVMGAPLPRGFGAAYDVVLPTRIGAVEGGISIEVSHGRRRASIGVPLTTETGRQSSLPPSSIHVAGRSVSVSVPRALIPARSDCVAVSVVVGRDDARGSIYQDEAPTVGRRVGRCTPMRLGGRGSGL